MDRVVTGMDRVPDWDGPGPFGMDRVPDWDGPGHDWDGPGPKYRNKTGGIEDVRAPL
jgi:hypothetical protein